MSALHMKRHFASFESLSLSSEADILSSKRLISSTAFVMSVIKIDKSYVDA